MLRHRSILEICSKPMDAMSRLRRHYGPRRASIRHSLMLGTILATYWTNKDAWKPPLNAYAQRCGSHLTTPMQCSISRCYCNEQTNMPKLQNTGGAISLAIVNPTGLHGRVDH